MSCYVFNPLELEIESNKKLLVRPLPSLAKGLTLFGLKDEVCSSIYESDLHQDTKSFDAIYVLPNTLEPLIGRHHIDPDSILKIIEMIDGLDYQGRLKNDLVSTCVALAQSVYLNTNISVLTQVNLASSLSFSTRKVSKIIEVLESEDIIKRHKLENVKARNDHLSVIELMPQLTHFLNTITNTSALNFIRSRLIKRTILIEALIKETKKTNTPAIVKAQIHWSLSW